MSGAIVQSYLRITGRTGGQTKLVLCAQHSAEAEA